MRTSAVIKEISGGEDTLPSVPIVTHANVCGLYMRVLDNAPFMINKIKLELANFLDSHDFVVAGQEAKAALWRNKCLVGHYHGDKIMEKNYAEAATILACPVIATVTRAAYAELVNVTGELNCFLYKYVAVMARAGTPFVVSIPALTIPPFAYDGTNIPANFAAHCNDLLTYLNGVAVGPHTLKKITLLVAPPTYPLGIVADVTTMALTEQGLNNAAMELITVYECIKKDEEYLTVAVKNICEAIVGVRQFIEQRSHLP